MGETATRKVESGGVHLKAMTLRGFKSFASATTLRFEPGITCVVGPNGSGKSNVVDALSWVMGEQGAKSLRGGKMEDVIFAGTTGRPPLGRAEVSLTIDNSDGALPIDYAEVTITRIMFRNGGSEYQINGDTCRLLDIQELLSDSGIGREMHVIVGQGQLDSVLHADPMGRRAFIEEAAGVLKHRKRKEKALRKLDAMQANLARVQDLTDELRRQLKPLGRQAAVARRAAVIQADLRDARLRLLADDLVRLREALRTRGRRRGRAEGAQGGRRGRAQGARCRARRSWRTRYGGSRRGCSGPSRPGTSSRSSPSGCAARSRWPTRGSRARPPRPRRSGAAATRRTWSARPPGSASRRRSWRPRWRRPSAPWRTPSPTAPSWSASWRVEERRLKDVARAIADRREGLARLDGQVNAARCRAASAQAEIDRLAAARDEAQERAVAAQEEYEQLQGRGRRAWTRDDADARRAARRGQARNWPRRRPHSARPARRSPRAERKRAAVAARREALALGLRRKDGTGALLAAKDRLSGLLGPAAELLTVAPGYEVAVAAALGAAADAMAVASPATAAEALRLLRKTRTRAAPRCC